MTRSQVYLAADLGASSGRLVAGEFDGDQLRLSELHRFENGPVHALGRMYWDFYALWSELQEGLYKAADELDYEGAIRSIGVDTWGVDFGLVGPGDELLGNPRHYRDARTRGALERAFARVPRSDIFEATGLQFLEFNSLYQLIEIAAESPELLDVTKRLLMMPDLFHWYLSGVQANEMTNATTTQFFDPRRVGWATDILDRFELPHHFLTDVVPPGTTLGPLRREVADDTGLPTTVQVVAPGTHDTASAVLAVPSSSPLGSDPDWCYISSGTWSLMGVEVREAVVSDRCRELNFTNEGGVGGTFRLLRNIAGLWPIQECRRIWAMGRQPFSWDEMTQMAEQIPPLQVIFNPDDPSLIAPSSMPSAIGALIARAKPQGLAIEPVAGVIIRSVLESLAMRYRVVLGWLEELVGHRLHQIHIVGGGTQNRLLCQMTADACRRPVVAGPIEATALGNIAMQLVADGAVASIDQARRLIRDSFPVERYEPRDADHWDEAWDQFKHEFS